MKRYAVLGWPRGNLVGFVWARDAHEAIAEARKIWVAGAIAVRRESR